MELALLFDLGSTFTKVRVVDLVRGDLIAAAESFTTINEGVGYGVKKALTEIKAMGCAWEKAKYKLACSSAAGGLRIVSIGLVLDLTVEAAKRASLGAGARVIKTFAYRLSSDELTELTALKPDIVLLAGGTDGGNTEVLLHNAELIAQGNLKSPIILAGNVKAAPKAEQLLREGNLEVYRTENVMPELEQLNIEPARKLIRSIFLKQIVKAKGLENLPAIDNILMPTPAAVLEALELLYYYQNQDIMIFDIGGATTDVYSAAVGDSKSVGVSYKGLREPLFKRTVEGDLGLRYSAESVLLNMIEHNLLTEDQIKQLKSYLQQLAINPAFIPSTPLEQAHDLLLGEGAIRLALDRHCGFLEEIYTPHGPQLFQHGKDLTQVKAIIGSGGIIAKGEKGAKIMSGVQDGTKKGMILRPQKSDLYLDSQYVLFAGGLLKQVQQKAALKLMENSMTKWERGQNGNGASQ